MAIDAEWAEAFAGRDQRDRVSAWVVGSAVLASYLALLAWRAAYWSTHPHPINFNEYAIDNLFEFLFFEANEPTLAVAVLASLIARLRFHKDVEVLLSGFTRRHPEHEPYYVQLLAAYHQSIGGRGRWLWTMTAVGLAGIFAGLFHWRYPDVGLTELPSLSFRSFSVLSLVWVLWWPFAATQHVFQPLLRDLSGDIQALHPDHCGGTEAFGVCILRVSSPVLATILLLLSWIALPFVSADYSPEFGASILVLLVLGGAPMLIYVSRPLWGVHKLLEQAKVRALEALWPLTVRPAEAQATFERNREAIAYIKGMSTWPMGSAISIIVLVASQTAAAALKVLPKALSTAIRGSHPA